MANRLLVLAALAALLMGCSAKLNDESVVARVGDRPITAGYYKQMLAKLKPEQLPRDKDGKPLDTATIEGKRQFLDILVNKELLVAKAIEMGYDKDTQINDARTQLLMYHGMIVFWDDAIGDPAKKATDADVERYYSRLGEKRNCDFIITDFEDDANKAREEAMAGTPWETIKERYHSKSADPNAKTNMDIPWGAYVDTFEREIFDVKIGGITNPIPTQQGFWVVRVNSVANDPKPALETIKVRVLDSIRKRKINLAQEDTKKEIRTKHKLVINEDALAIIFAGLPAEEQIINPQTNQPTPREALKPLAVGSEYFDEVLYSFDLSTGPVTFTVGDYKARFDEMNVFDRPKKAELLGSLRRKLTGAADKAILEDEVKTRGYLTDKRTLSRVDRELEEMLVEKVHNEVVSFDQNVSPADLNAFWAEHGSEYLLPEIREGHMVLCKDRATAEMAREFYLKHSSEINVWKSMNKMYGSSAKLEGEFGRLHQIRADDTTVIGKDVLFSLTQGGLSQPTEVQGGWAVIFCDAISPPRQQELSEKSEAVGQRMRNIRQDEALTKLLGEWRAHFGVKVEDKVLAKLPSLDELLAGDPSLKPVVEKPVGKGV